MSTLGSTVLAQWIGAQSQKVIVNYLDSPKFKEWDIAVFDFMLEISGMYLADKWGVTVIFNSVTLSFTPMLLPTWPFPVLSSQYFDDMTFLQRLTNTLILPFVHASKVIVVLRNAAVIGTEKCPPVSKVLFNGAANGYPLMINSVVGFEFPRSFPSVMTHYTGPLLPMSSPALTPYYTSTDVPQQITVWLDSHLSAKDVIVISMGSTAHLTKSIAQSIIQSIQQTNHSAIWSLGASVRSIVDGLEVDKERIFIVSWMPQKIVLNHPSVKLAILHGGLGGIQEALSSEVPIICLPQMFDQRDNAARLEYRHLGVAIDPLTLTTTKLVGAIDLITNKYSAYKDAVIKVNKLYTMAGGVERAAELVELYEKVGYLDRVMPCVQKDDQYPMSYKGVLYAAIITVVMCFVIRSQLFSYSNC